MAPEPDAANPDALSGQLAPLLSDDEAAAGRLWDMSKAPLQLGHQLMLEYGDFPAQQLGRSREAKSVPAQDAPLEAFHQLVREPDAVPEEVSSIHQSDDMLRLLPPELATISIRELEFYRCLVEKRLLTSKLEGDA